MHFTGYWSCRTPFPVFAGELHKGGSQEHLSWKTTAIRNSLGLQPPGFAMTAGPNLWRCSLSSRGPACKPNKTEPTTAAIVQLELETCTLRTRLVLHSCDFQAGAQTLYFAFQPELETCTSRTILELQSCDFPASAGNLCFARWTGTAKLRFSSWSWKPVLRALDVRYKVAIFQRVLDF